MATGPDVDAQFVAEELGELTPKPEPQPSKPRRRRGPGRPKRGVCRECGEPASSPQGTYCDEHEPVKADRAPKARTPASRTPKIETELRTNLEMLGTMWQVSDPVCGGAMVEAAPRIASAWAAQAKANPRVARVVETVAGGGGLVGLVLAHAPLVMAIYAHHVVAPRQARQEAATTEPPVGTIDRHPTTGVPYVYRGEGAWEPAKPDDLAAAGWLDQTGEHGDESAAGSG